VAFEEDRAMITAQQRLLKLDPSFRTTFFNIDAALSQYRALVRERVQAEAAAAESPDPQRPAAP
jgi:vanillate O-demethylase monooxygenase subunit